MARELTPWVVNGSARGLLGWLPSGSAWTRVSVLCLVVGLPEMVCDGSSPLLLCCAVLILVAVDGCATQLEMYFG
jgi:hypothetical protein